MATRVLRGDLASAQVPTSMVYEHTLDRTEVKQTDPASLLACEAGDRYGIRLRGDTAADEF